MAQLYIETREDVYRYLLTLGVHPPKAQEAVQEVFLRLYASLKKGEKIESLRGWVFRVAHNYGLKVRARQSSEEKFDPAFEARLASPVGCPEGAACAAPYGASRGALKLRPGLKGRETALKGTAHRAESAVTIMRRSGSPIDRVA